MNYLSYILIIINIILLVYILVKIKNKERFSKSMKVLLGVGIFFSLGSVSSVTNANNEFIALFPSIEASVFAIISYLVYIVKVKSKKQSREEINTIEDEESSISNENINSNVTNNIENYAEKIKKDKNSINKKRKKKSSVSTFFGVIFLVIVAFIVIIGSSTDIQYKSYKNMFAEYSVSYDEVSKIVSNCGFTNVSITRDELIDNLWEDGTIGFRIKSDQSRNTTLYIKDNSVYNIRYADIDLYKNGEYLDNEIVLGCYMHLLTDNFFNDYTNKNHLVNEKNYYISHNEHIKIMLKSQEIINKILKSPSTAKYPLYDQWSIVKNKENITVQCYVDAQNSFGAVGRSYFQIILSNNVVTSLIFDGKEFIK